MTRLSDADIRAMWDETDYEREREAVDYVERYGNRGLRLIAKMWDRLKAGKQLTDVQIEQVLMSRDAEVRSSRRAAERISKQEVKAMQSIDLNRVFIGPEVEDGSYAVETPEGIVIIRIREETQPGFHGFRVVEHVVGEETERYGVQYPQPSRVVNGYRQWYRGAYAHLVAQLVSDPLGAKALYNNLEDAL